MHYFVLVILFNDPEAKVALENARLNNVLKKAQITQINDEIALRRKYGGLTPEQYNKQLEDEMKRRRAEQESFDQAKEDVLLTQENLTKADAILSSRAIDTIVGPNPFSRGSFRQKGIVGTVVSGITRGAVDEITGGADDTVALVQQMIDDQFLNKLIDVKSKGATFGALSDNEGQALRNAANAIAQTAIKDDGKVIGYDMSEKLFRQEIGIIREMTRRANERASGELFTTDEQDIFDELFNQQINPAF